VLRDRDYLIIRKTIDITNNFLFIKNNTQHVFFNKNNFKFDNIIKEKFTLDTSPNVACLDRDTLVFPLQLRYWKEGDIFQPLGMNGKHQKVSDFFTNHKLSQFEKEAVPILMSGEEICWIVGYRIDERFKVTSETRNVLKIERT